MGHVGCEFCGLGWSRDDGAVVACLCWVWCRLWVLVVGLVFGVVVTMVVVWKRERYGGLGLSFGLGIGFKFWFGY